MEIERPDWVSQMESVLESLNEGVMIADDCHKIIWVNECLLEMCGLAVSDLLGSTSGSFYSGADQTFLYEQIARGEQIGRNRFEFYLPRRDGGGCP